MTIARLLILILIAAVLTGCSQDSDITRYKVPVTPDEPAVSAEDATGVHWSLPAGWKKATPPSSMNMAAFSVDESGAPACTVTELSGDGGGVMANVNRWRRQIGLGAASEEDVKKALKPAQSGLGDFLHLALVNEANPDKAFLAAIMPSGQKIYFVKLALPADVVLAAQPAFLQFCGSFHAAGPGHSHGDH